jgi:hypothetical protein
MSAVRSSAIALHVEAAKRLLDELEQHAATALDALGADDAAEFLAVVDERDRILRDLTEVVQALAHERVADPSSQPETSTLLAEMAQAASAALESHEHLMARTQRERDRLAVALERAKRPDAVASQYAVATAGPRSATLSVTG